MHNTRSAMANLVNRYKAVLNKCRLLNTFGTLAFTAVLTTGLSVGLSLGGDIGGVGTAHATTLGTTVDSVTGELTGLSKVEGLGATVDYSQILDSTDLYTDVIKDPLTALGSEAGPYGDGADWEDYLQSVMKDTNYDWENDYMASVANLFASTSVSSAYTVKDITADLSALTDETAIETEKAKYYTTFTLYSINDDGTTTPTEYGILLKNCDYTTDNDSTSNNIQSLIEDYLENEVPTITHDTTTSQNSVYSSISLGTTTSLYSGTISYDGADITYYVTQTSGESYESVQVNVYLGVGGYSSRSLGDITKNYVGANTSPTTYDANGGALAYINYTNNASITVDSITGDFIGNSIASNHASLGLNTPRGNGGAIALFANNNNSTSNSASVTIGTITGDFIGNSAERAGGAIYLFSNNYAVVSIDSITGNFIGNTSQDYGAGAIANYGGTIGSITGSFIGNTTENGGGGAIDNFMLSSLGERTVTITSIVGDFIGNSAYSTTGSGIDGLTYGSGGAIRNYMYTYGDATGDSASTIADIIGNFIGNTAQNDGGAIYNFAHSDTSNVVNNTAIISTVTGNFIGNTAIDGSGGAIYNDDSDDSTALIGIITGNFIGNTAGTSGGAIYNTSRIYTVTGSFIQNAVASATNNLSSGGAIYNAGHDGTAEIDSITGDFIENSAEFLGGAIYNYANGGVVSIGDITGNFISNTVINDDKSVASGGAIANYSGTAACTATIGNITGNFINNSATKYGGAIYNDSNTYGDVVITSITGNFIGNYVDATDDSITYNVRGGAIYNDDTIGAIAGSFIGNYVTAKDSNTAQGGAIYTTSDMEFVANGETIFFSDNYVTTDGGTTKDYNAIFAGVDNITNDTKNRTLTFSMSGTGGNVVMNDSISGNTEYTPLTITNYEGSTATVSALTGDSTISITGTGISASQTGTASTTTVSTGVCSVSTTDTDADTNANTTTTTTITAVSTTVDNGTTATTYTKETVTVTNNTVVSTTSVGSTEEEYTSLKNETSAQTSTTTVKTTTIKEGTTTLASYETSTDADGTTTTTATVNNSDTTAGTSTKTTITYTGTSGTAIENYYDTATNMTGETAYGVEIIGDGKDTNTFYLNAEVENFGSFTIENATLFLSSYTHTDGETTTVGGLTALDSLSTVTFGENSQLTIDMSAYEDKVMSTDGTIMADAVLTGRGAALTIVDSSSLRLTKATTGNTYTILEGFNVADIQGEYAWDASNITMDSSLQTVTIVRDGYNDTLAEVVDGSTAITTYNVTDSSDDSDSDSSSDSSGDSSDAGLVRNSLSTDTTDATDGTAVTDTTDSSTLVAPDQDPSYFVISVVANEDSPLADSSISEIVINAANTQGFGPSSDNTGSRFLYDVSTIDGDREQVAVLEGAVSLAKVAGVSTNTYRINRSSSDALASRLNNLGDTDTVLASYDSGMGESAGSSDTVITAQGGNDDGLAKASKKYESVALWFVPMYSHDRVDGASVAGYNADFTTNIYGGVAGVDKTISDDGANALGADLYRVGVAVHMGVGETTTRGDFDSIDNDFNFGGAFVYGVAEYGNLTLSADIGFSKIYSEIDQDLSAYGFAGTNADVHSSAWGVDVRGTYRIETDAVNIVPYAGLEFVSMKTEDYQVKRSDVAGGTIFNVTNDRQNILSAPVGVTFDKQFVSEYGWTVTPQLSLGAIFAMGDLEEDSLITMPGVAGSGRTSMEVVDQVTFDMSVGMALMKGNWTLGLDYELQMSENRTGHALVGLVQYRF